LGGAADLRIGDVGRERPRPAEPLHRLSGGDGLEPAAMLGQPKTGEAVKAGQVMLVPEAEKPMSGVPMSGAAGQIGQRPLACASLPPGASTWTVQAGTAPNPYVNPRIANVPRQADTAVAELREQLQQVRREMKELRELLGKSRER
jgi:hypothetical protein